MQCELPSGQVIDAYVTPVVPMVDTAFWLSGKKFSTQITKFLVRAYACDMIDIYYVKSIGVIVKM